MSKLICQTGTTVSKLIGWNNFDLLIVLSSAVDFSQYFVRNFVSINPKILRKHISSSVQVMQ